MNFRNYIVTEPASLFKDAARYYSKGRWKMLIAASLIYYLCVSAAVIVIDAITGTYDNLQATMEALYALPQPVAPEQFLAWYQEYAGSMSSRSNVSFLYTILVTGPFSFGLTSVFLRVLRFQPAQADMVFSGFSAFLRAFLLYLVQTIFIALWSILLLVPGIIAYYRYSLAWYLIADHPQMGALEAITLSKELMRGNKLKRFTIDLSFLGWFVLAGLFAGFFGALLTAGFLAADSPHSVGIQALTIGILAVIASAPIISYHGVAVAEFYRRIYEPYRAGLPPYSSLPPGSR
ncbi:MAG: DUF975 family protein [Clostridiales Family XIII bacterium]|nr:DUF975 family protein [Clostridiales Family XIII bacterium]